MRAIRIVVGLILMAGFVVGVTALVVQRAGGWGVPYFSFVSERGSPCENTLTGYVCRPTTLADVEFFGQVSLPPDSTVTRGTYVSTQDYQLDAQLEVPSPSAAAALTALSGAFGRCTKDPPLINVDGLTKVCVLSNGNRVVESGEADSRLYTITTGLHPDGSRTISLSIHSR